jgi:hypothetical protein
MQRVMADSHRPSKDLLLQPLPLASSSGGLAAGGPGGARTSKRTSSFSGATATASAAAIVSASERADAPEAAAPKKPSPAKLSVALPTAPQLPSNFPATPTAHMALAGGLHKERPPLLSLGGAAGAAAGSGIPAYGLHSPLPSSASQPNRFAADRPQSGDSGASAGSSPSGSPGTSGSGAKRLSHLSEVGRAGEPRAPAAAAAAAAAPPAAPKRAASPSASSGLGGAGAGGAGSPLRPSLKVTVPGEGDFHLAPDDSDGDVVYSPSTPAFKSGIKERMKVYFQRQAGQAGGL